MEASNIIIVAVVIGARLLLPLLIPRFPLAIILCLIVDAADQTIFQRFTTVNLDNYQSYDKALDIYYLSIAYLSTFKNWTNHAAFKISRFLFYYRMIGVLLYEFIHNGIILFIFPNTFEYFFIFYSVIALRWNPKKLSTRFLLGSAAFIWIFIKLPQEYWIHIAHIDTTDLIKEKIFHVPVTTSFEQIFVMFPWVLPALIGAIVIIILAAIIIIKKLPPGELNFTLSSRVKDQVFTLPKISGFTRMIKIYKFDYLEKVIFVGIISVIFAQVFPSLRGSGLNVFFGITLVILFNATFSYLLLNSSKFNPKLVSNFFLMFVVNTLLAFTYAKIVAGVQSQISFLTVMFFAYILTLITVLYDRFKPYYIERFKIG